MQLVADILRTGKAIASSPRGTLKHSVLNQPDAVSEDFSLVRKQQHSELKMLPNQRILPCTKCFVVMRIFSEACELLEGPITASFSRLCFRASQASRILPI